MNTCRDVCEHAAQLLGPASPDEGPEIEALRRHLALCPPCAEHLRQIGITVDALKRVPGTCGEKARAELLKRYEDWCRDRSCTPTDGEEP